MSLCLPAAARAQSQDTWSVDIAPLYFWASELSGELSTNRGSQPVFLSFGDATDHLSGIFTFHGEARKGRWGMVGDVGFVRLSTETPVTVPGLLPGAPDRSVSSRMKLANTIVEAAATYLVSPSHDLAVVAGLRGYTMAPSIDLTGASGQVTPVDDSKTSVTMFGGIQYRPRLSERWRLVTRADAGGGDGRTWSATAAAEFQASRMVGVLLGYRALGIHTGTLLPRNGLTAGSAPVDLAYDMTHYGPVAAATIRWGAR